MRVMMMTVTNNNKKKKKKKCIGVPFSMAFLFN